MALPVPSLVVDGAAPGYAQHLTTDVNDALNRLAVAASDAIEEVEATVESIDELDRAYAEYATYGTATVVIPTDDTVPLVTEGTVILSATITPHSASNIIRVSLHINCSGDAALNANAALFRTTTCVAAWTAFISGAGVTGEINQWHEETGLTADTPVTYSVRVGPGANTMYLNGNSANRLFGGVAKCTLVLEELKP